jgi:uncharacterized protein
VRDLDSGARVEVAPEDVVRLMTEPLRGEVEGRLIAVGFTAVEIDPEGYRPGKLHGLKMESDPS